MLVRKLISAIVILVPAAAFSQVSGAESQIRSGLMNWAGSGLIRIKMDGAVSYAGRRDDFRVIYNRSLTYNTNGSLLEQVEITETKNGQLVQRIVGDGMTLYSFNVRKNEVATSTYGKYDAGATDYVSKLNDGVASVVSGQATQLVRIVRDMYHPGGTTFRNWMPGGTWQNLNTAGAHNDPLNPNRRYFVTPTMSYWLITAGNPMNKSMAFEMDSSSGSQKLGFIYYTETIRIGDDLRWTDWQLGVETPLAFGKGTFEFVPPANARIIPGPKIAP